jgi:hypothetical protein
MLFEEKNAPKLKKVSKTDFYHKWQSYGDCHLWLRMYDALYEIFL